MRIPLSRPARGLSRQVYAALRREVLGGALHAGDQLPSTRELSERLEVSRTVVLVAYDQLIAEGFAVGRAGSGTYISGGAALIPPAPASHSAKLRLARFGLSAAAAWPRVMVPGQRSTPLRYDFAYGLSDLETFPFATWRRLLSRYARTASATQLDYGPASGDAGLREQIAAHLRRSRAVSCDASQIVITSGSQQALDLIARVLIERGDPVAIEDPSYQGTAEVLRSSGARLIPVPVDRDGLDPARLPRTARLLCVTPSHQFPTGAILPLARRLRLLEWARRCNAAVIEDDYDGEFRYKGQLLESLQGLDRDSRVIYIGTFSRTLFSALRIGYLVSPKDLIPAFAATKWLSDRHTPTLEQRALAAFMSGGLYERYLRRVRRRNATRREALLEAIGRYLRNRVEVSGDGAGAHIVLWPTERTTEDILIAAAASCGVCVYGLSPYRLAHPTRPGILLGYSRLTEREIQEGIRRLSKAF